MNVKMIVLTLSLYAPIYAGKNLESNDQLLVVSLDSETTGEISDSEENGDVKKEKETCLQTESLRRSPDNIRNRDYLDSGK